MSAHSGDAKFQAETRARSRQIQAITKGVEMVRKAQEILDRALNWAYNDGADCWMCGGTGTVYWAPAHGANCSTCGGTGKYQENEAALHTGGWPPK
jgi:hypothetical protein